MFINYLPNIAAESTHQPHLRQPPLRNNTTAPGGAHYNNMMQSVVLAREPAESITAGHDLHDGDVYVIGDGGKYGNLQAIMQVFSKPTGGLVDKVSKSLMVHYAEEDVLSSFVFIVVVVCLLFILLFVAYRTSLLAATSSAATCRWSKPSIFIS